MPAKGKKGEGDGVLGQCRRLSICTCSKNAVHFPWHQDAVSTKHLDERAAGKKHFFHTFLVHFYKFFLLHFFFLTFRGYHPSRSIDQKQARRLMFSLLL